MSALRVVVADDSPVVAGVLSRILSSDDNIEVVGIARDGVEALKLVLEKKPDLLCTDFYMPHMNGLQLTQHLMMEAPLPIIVVTVAVNEGGSTAMDLYDAGALDVIGKPRAGFSPGSKEATELVRKVKTLAGVRVVRRRSFAMATFKENTYGKSNIIAIGGSTGAPPVFSQIIGGLSGSRAPPILCVQHIGDGFLDPFLGWLKRTTSLHVKVADDHEPPQSGHVYFPKEGHHLIVTGNGNLFNTGQPEHLLHRPSVDQLFFSLAEKFNGNIMAILLTGMGQDGAAGLLKLKEKGATTIAQDEATSIVFGMPGKAVELGAARHILPPIEILGAIKRFAQSHPVHD